MTPDENRPTTPTVVPPRQSTGTDISERSHNPEEAANIVRDQIEHIYQQDPDATITVPVAAPSDQTNIQYAHQDDTVTNPYERTHDESMHPIQASMWQKYHSAWQSYYQQYYERYYVGQVHEAKKSLEAQFGREETKQDATLSTDEAMYDLRSKLRQKIHARAAKVRKSRHFLPIVSALAVMLVFAFLQYNRVIFAAVDAYVAPGSMSNSALIVDPTATNAVGPDPVLIIPRISVEVPIIWTADASSQDSLNDAMNKGVAWFNINGASAKPGEVGNFVLSGHSSNDWFDQGNYKFIFARLDQLAEGDTVYVNYNSTRYTYQITKKEVVKPTDVSALTQATTKPTITLVTCTPLGTALNRLLVFGEQVSPDPSTASKTTTSTDSTSATQMPSNSATFFERLFGIKN
jgi:sortase A